MLKTTAFYISFLGLLSVVYHLVYWGCFDIDIFQFISLPDFITGIAYPLRTAVAFALLFLVLIALSYPYIQENDPAVLKLNSVLEKMSGMALASYDKREEWLEAVQKHDSVKFNEALNEHQAERLSTFRTGFRIVIALVLTSGAVYYFFLSTNAWFASWTAFIIASLILTLLQLAYGRFNNLLNLESQKQHWIRFIDEFLITLIVFLPINAGLAGYTEAQRVLTKESYKYVSAAAALLPANTQASDTLIYLGKVSTSYFFVSTDFKQHFIVPVDNAPVLNYQLHTAQ